MMTGSGRAVTSAYPASTHAIPLQFGFSARTMLRDCCVFQLIHDQDSPFLHNLDVAGYNYAGVGVYETDHEKLPVS